LESIKVEGQKGHFGPLRLTVRARTDVVFKGPRLVVSLGKRVGPAHLRNRFKRKIREFVRTHPQELKGFDYWVWSQNPLSALPANFWNEFFSWWQEWVHRKNDYHKV
jgi:ribonuclease P protein component